MAITKIHAIKSTLGKALAYIENPDKTDGQMLVSGYNCEPQTASIDFEMTAVLAHKARNLKRKRSTNLAYHLIQSFSPEDAVTPEQISLPRRSVFFHEARSPRGSFHLFPCRDLTRALGRAYVPLCFRVRAQVFW